METTGVVCCAGGATLWVCAEAQPTFWSCLLVPRGTVLVLLSQPLPLVCREVGCTWRLSGRLAVEAGHLHVVRVGHATRGP